MHFAGTKTLEPGHRSKGERKLPLWSRFWDGEHGAQSIYGKGILCNRSARKNVELHKVDAKEDNAETQIDDFELIRRY